MAAPGSKLPQSIAELKEDLQSALYSGALTLDDFQQALNKSSHEIVKYGQPGPSVRLTTSGKIMLLMKLYGKENPDKIAQEMRVPAWWRWTWNEISWEDVTHRERLCKAIATWD